MSAVDNTLSKEGSGTEKDGEITEKGKLEIQRGIADLKGRSRSSSVTSGAAESSSPRSVKDVSGKQSSFSLQE
jgi:hypothetical protein